MKEYSDFTWTKNKLYDGDIHWATVIPHETLKGMWRIQWEGNREFSTDFWNKTRAMDNATKFACSMCNMMAEIARTEPADAFK